MSEGRESYIWAADKLKAPTNTHTHNNGIPEKDQRLTSLHSEQEKK